MTVLVTGAAGQIGSNLIARLPEFGWEVRGFDRRPARGAVVGDVRSSTDLDASMSGVAAIVHMAGATSRTPWPSMCDTNINGTYQIFEAARRSGVARVIYASSNHVTGFSESTDEAPADLPVRPDTVYGATKAFAEALGRHYVDRYGLRVACLRIGTFAPIPRDLRSLATWISPADCARLVDACLRSDGFTYTQIWGVSANTRCRWSHAAGKAIGYVPRDNAEDYANQIVHTESDTYQDRIGGRYVSIDFGIDELAKRWRAEQKEHHL